MNFAYWLRRIYIVETDLAASSVPENMNPVYWCQKLAEFAIYGATDNQFIEGKTCSFWLSQWYFFLLGLGIQPPTFERDPAFWLEKIYRLRLGVSTDSVALRRNKEFWARAFLFGVAEGPPPLTLESYLISILDADNGAMWTYQDTGSTLDNVLGDANLDGTISGVTMEQPGAYAGDLAGSYDGVDDTVTITNTAKLANLTTQRWCVLAKMLSLGENNFGTLFFFDHSAAGGHILRLDTSNSMEARIECATTDAQIQTSINSIGDVIGSWAIFFFDYDDADDLGNGRKIRVFKGISDTVTELTKTTDTAGVGAVLVPDNDLTLGSALMAGQVVDGLISLIAVDNGLWTTAEMEQITTLAGV